MTYIIPVIDQGKYLSFGVLAYSCVGNQAVMESQCQHCPCFTPLKPIQSDPSANRLEVIREFNQFVERRHE